jgi:hypothetical protein
MASRTGHQCGATVRVEGLQISVTGRGGQRRRVLDSAVAPRHRRRGGEMSKVAIVQSNYIPWKGYFDLIASADRFVLLDDVQYTRRDWRNRNKVKTPHGAKWLTVPVQSKGRYLQRIDEVTVEDASWVERHWNALERAYAQAPHFDEFRDIFRQAYLECAYEPRLSRINRRLIDVVCSVLDICTPISWSADFGASGVKTERLLDICLKVGADEYLSGPSARGYLDERLLRDAGVRVSWMDYSGYPEYPQLHPPFSHHVTVLDLVFNVGSLAPSYLKAACARV